MRFNFKLCYPDGVRSTDRHQNLLVEYGTHRLISEDYARAHKFLILGSAAACREYISKHQTNRERSLPDGLFISR